MACLTGTHCLIDSTISHLSRHNQRGVVTQSSFRQVKHGDFYRCLLRQIGDDTGRTVVLHIELDEVQLLGVLNQIDTVVVVLILRDVLVDEVGLQRGLTRASAACDTNGSLVAQAKGKEVQHIRSGSTCIDQHFSGDAGFVLLTDRGCNTQFGGDDGRNGCRDTGAGADEGVDLGSLSVQKLTTHTDHALDDVQRCFGGSKGVIVVEEVGTRGTDDFHLIVGVDVDLLDGGVLEIAGQNTQTSHVLIDALHQTVTVIVDACHILGGILQDQHLQGLNCGGIIQSCAQLRGMVQGDAGSDMLQNAKVVCGVGFHLRLLVVLCLEDRKELIGCNAHSSSSSSPFSFSQMWSIALVYSLPILPLP